MIEQYARRNYSSKLTGFLLVIGVLLSYGCEKLPGEGGGALIQGKVLYEIYAPNNDLLRTEIAIAEEVYLKYGDSTFPDDDVDTDDGGMFEFQYLRKGNYSLYAIEDCQSCPSEKRAVELLVDIKGNKEVVLLEDIILRKDLAHNDGEASIIGRVLLNGIPVPFGRIFIYYNNEIAPLDDVRSDVNGYFLFSELIEGSYTITATNNNDINTATDTKEGTLSTKNEVLNLGDFNISL